MSCSSLLTSPKSVNVDMNGKNIFFSHVADLLLGAKKFCSARIFHPLNAHVLLFGDESSTDKDHEFIFKQVQDFLKHTGRSS